MQPQGRRSLLVTGATLLVTAGCGARAAGSPGLTTHMLDVSSGRPAAGVRIDFSRLVEQAWQAVRTVHTDADGRNAEPLLTAATMATGQYELVFHIAEYFSRTGTVLPDPPFLDTAVIRFGIADATAHYHVPLLASPWTYTTYRGS